MTSRLGSTDAKHASVEFRILFPVLRLKPTAAERLAKRRLFSNFDLSVQPVMTG